MRPARKGDGTGLSFPGYSEVRKGDGTVLWSAGGDIPDSVVAQDKLFAYWGMSEGSGSTVSEPINEHTGTIEGVSWVSGTWHEDHALDGDGTGYVETTTWGAYGSNLTGGMALAFTIDTTDSDFPSIIRVQNSGDSTQLYVFIRDTGTIQFNLFDSSGDNIAIQGSTNIADGSPHRVVCQKTGDSAADMEINVDGGSDSTTTSSDENFSNPTDFDVTVPFFGTNSAGSISAELDGVLDNIIAYDDSLSSTEIQDDYNNQPWS